MNAASFVTIGQSGNPAAEGIGIGATPFDPTPAESAPIPPSPLGRPSPADSAGTGSPPADDILDIVVLAPRESAWGTVAWLLVIAILLVGLGILAWYLLRRFSSRREDTSPEARASRRLRELAERHGEMEPNPFALAVSDTLKDYLVEKFKDPVRFETTQEFLARSSTGPSRLPRAARESLQEFLVSTEEIKFGNTSGAEQRTEPLLERAGMIVQLCQAADPEPRPVETPAEEKPPGIPLPPESK